MKAMPELTQADIESLSLIYEAGKLDGGLLLPAGYRGVPPRKYRRLLDAGYVEVRGERLCPTVEGVERLKEVSRG